MSWPVEKVRSVNRAAEFRLWPDWARARALTPSFTFASPSFTFSALILPLPEINSFRIISSDHNIPETQTEKSLYFLQDIGVGRSIDIV